MKLCNYTNNKIYYPINKLILRTTVILSISVMLLCISCSKDFLDKKPDKALVVPETIKDLQALLDLETTTTSSPVFGELSCDDYYVAYTNWVGLVPLQKDGYIWNKSYVAATNPDWSNSYSKIFYANTVLEGIAKIKYDPLQQVAFDNVKGSALFLRARAFYRMSSVFMEAYDLTRSNTLLGLVLKLDTDSEKPYSRSTMQQTYDQIIKDLIQAIPLLPVTPLYKSRPSKPAAHALLTGIYLNMGLYEKSLKHADTALSLYNKLTDYNTLNPGASLPFLKFNEEVVYDEDMLAQAIFINPRRIVDSTLYSLYETNDLRKSLFFFTSSGVINFKGQYTGSAISNFSGTSTAELYLIRAECNARIGNTTAALSDLNMLLKNRWKTGTYSNIIETDGEKLLIKILEERRKELLFRGIRWMDLRRLNKDPRFAKTIYRNLNGIIYSLPPNDLRYTCPIPENEIKISGIQQNPR